MWPFDLGKKQEFQKQIQAQQAEIEKMHAEQARTLDSKRKRSARRAFAGAMYGRLVSDWVTSTTSMDAELRTSLPQLRNRSRQLGRDNDYVRNFLRTAQNNIVGEGIPFQSQVRKQRKQDELDEAVNDQIESSWKRWSRKDSCHVGGTLSFSDIERLVIRSVIESGEVIVRFVYQRMGRSKVHLSLELIESDMLDDQYNGRAPNGNQVRMGVEVNTWGRPVAYYFLSSHPGDYQPTPGAARSLKRIRVPADEVLHLYVTERLIQSRGVPWMVSAILRLHHMQGYEEAEVIAARASASLMGFIESPEAESSIEDDVVDGQSVTEFEPGLIKKLDPGEKFNVPNMSRPGGQFDPFMRLMIRGVAAGVGCSYEGLSRDYSQSNYSSSRLAIQDDRDNWRVIQKWVVTNFHQAVFERFMDVAVLSGDVTLKNYETAPEVYQAVKWMPRGWGYIDPLKEVAANKEAVRNGFMTQTEAVAQNGGDLEELFAQRRREIALAKKYGLVFDSNPEEVNAVGAAQTTSPETPATAE
jgi:lambda family phage portal protein